MNADLLNRIERALDDGTHAALLAEVRAEIEKLDAALLAVRKLLAKRNDSGITTRAIGYIHQQTGDKQ